MLNPVSTRTEDHNVVPSENSLRCLFFECLERDADAWQRRGWAPGLTGWRRYFRLLTFGGYRATALYRLAHWAHTNGIPWVPTTLHEVNQALHGLEMTPSMVVGAGLYMPHTVGSVITAAKIGEEVELQGGITLGMRGAHGFPILDDEVMVSCGARVLGTITVGRGSIIGANAVVIRDVAPCSVMVGVPARALPSRIEQR